MKSLLASLLLASLACAVDRGTAPVPGFLRQGSVGRVMCSSGPGTSAGLWVNSNVYTCAETIWVRNASSRSNAEIQAGIDTWNDVLGAYGLPVYALRGVGGMYNVYVFDSTATDTFVCGKTDITAGRIALFYSHSKVGCSGDSKLVAIPTDSTDSTEQVGALIAHELGHALGFLKHFDQAADTAFVRQDTVAGKCVMAVPQHMNESLCENEKEIVYYQYQLTPVFPVDSGLYVTGTRLSKLYDTLEMNSTAVDTVTYLLIPGHPNAPPVPSDSIQWSLVNVTPAGAVTLSSAVGSLATIQSHGSGGSATLQATVVGSATYVVGWPFSTGQTEITVLPPPSVWIQSFYPDSIAPVHSNQLCVYGANASGGTGSYTYQWYLNGAAAGTGLYLDASIGRFNTTVKVVAYSAGDSAVASKTVAVTSTGQTCP